MDTGVSVLIYTGYAEGLAVEVDVAVIDDTPDEMAFHVDTYADEVIRLVEEFVDFFEDFGDNTFFVLPIPVPCDMVGFDLADAVDDEDTL